MSAAARTPRTAHAVRLAWLLPGLLALLVSYALLRFLLLPVLPGLGPEVAASRAQGPALWPAALNSLRLATLAAAGAVLPALWLGLMLERRAWRGRGRSRTGRVSPPDPRRRREGHFDRLLRVVYAQLAWPRVVLETFALGECEVRLTDRF